MSKSNTTNGRPRLNLLGAPAPAPAEPRAKPVRAYSFHPHLSDEETARLVTGGMDPDDYCVVICPSAMAPQPAQPLQQMQVMDPETGLPCGTGLLFLVPVVLPMEVPKIAGGMLGANGKPLGQMQLELPPGALARVLVPRKHLTPEGKAEIKALSDAVETNTH